MTKWLTVFPSPSNQIGCDYFHSTRARSKLSGLLWCWHTALQLTDPLPSISMPSAGHSWIIQPSALCTISWNTGKVSTDPLCGPSTHHNHNITLTTPHACNLTAAASSPKTRVMWAPTAFSIRGAVKGGYTGKDFFSLEFFCSCFTVKFCLELQELDLPHSNWRKHSFWAE